MNTAGNEPESLTEAETAVIGECLRAAADGPFFADFTEGEHHTVFGVMREDMARVASSWPQVDEDEDTLTTINGAMLNLIGYPHGHRKVWDDYISVPEAELERIFYKWRRLRDADRL